MSLFSELKRRNVLKVVTAYIVVAWLLMQVADVVLNNIEAPDWVFHVILLLLALGLPLALVLSWAFELTPDGVKRDADLVKPPTQAVAEDVATKPDDFAASTKSIAVLPFLNMSSDSEQDFFSDGISEELLNLLAKIPALHVAARISSFTFKGTSINVKELGRELNVAHVLEGSVRKAGDRIRVTAQLIKIESGYQMWSETWDRTLEDIFAVQDEIAAAVVGHLRVSLLGEIPRLVEIDPAAYSLYLQARHLSHQGTAVAWERSAELYQQVLETTPDYVAALDGLAEVYIGQTDRGLRLGEEGYSLIKETASRALAVDPNYANAHAHFGWLANVSDDDPATAAQYYQRALELAPADIDILDGASALASQLGRLEQAIELQEYVVARDPINPGSHRRLGGYYHWIGRYDDAIASFRVALTLSPGYVATWQFIGMAMLLNGDAEAALAAVQQETWKGYREIGLVMVYYALGRIKESDAALAAQIAEREEVVAFNVAYALAFRGEIDRAFEWLDKAVLYKDAGLCQVAVVPLFANLYNDARWEPFLEKIGRSPKQLAVIPFDVTLVPVLMS